MSKKNKAYQEPTHAEISARAQQIYEREGRPEGKATEHWLKAESQLIAERKAESASMPAPEKSRATTPAASAAPSAPSWQAPPRQGLRK